MDRSRSAMKARIASLVQMHCQSEADFNAAVAELVKAKGEDARWDVLEAVYRAFADLKEATPVDTGRARSGWQITDSYSEADSYCPGPDRASIDAAARKAADAINSASLTKAQTVWVYNNVVYILALEAGWSKRQPGGFIGRFLSQLQAAVAHFGASHA